MRVSEAVEKDRLGPYHGRWEGYAKLSLALALLCSGIGIAALVLYYRVEARAHSEFHSAMTAVAVGGIVLLILLSALQSVTFFKRLGAQVSAGNGNVEVLDKLRLIVGQTVLNLSLVVVLVTFQLLSLAVSRH